MSIKTITPASAVTLGVAVAGVGAGIWAGTHISSGTPVRNSTGVTAGMFGLASAPLAFAGLLQLGGGSARLGAALIAPAVGTIVGLSIARSQH
jgi:hypothetical protein